MKKIMDAIIGNPEKAGPARKYTAYALLGTVANFNTNGIDFALTALFITVFVEQWLNSKNHVYAIIGVVSSLICLFVFGKDSFLIPAMILITVALAVYKKVGAKNE
jgi:4-azaleucine resistance transporter AzlC